MHTNHRRKRGRHRGRYWARQSYNEDRKIFWGWFRAAERNHIRHEKYDTMLTRTRHSVQWED